jgi:hypothetical protein
LVANQPSVKRCGRLTDAAHEASGLRAPHEDAAAASGGVEEPQIEHRRANATLEIADQLGTDLGDRSVGCLDVVHFELPLGVDIEPVEQVLPEVEHQRQEDAIFTIQGEFQLHRAWVEVVSQRVISEHESGKATLEATQRHACIVVHHHDGIASARCERLAAIQVDELGRTIGPGGISQISRALRDQGAVFALELELVVGADADVLPRLVVETDGKIQIRLVPVCVGLAPVEKESDQLGIGHGIGAVARVVYSASLSTTLCL